MPVAVNRVGFGGPHNTSTFVQESRRYVPSLSVALAFMLTGHMYSFLSQRIRPWPGHPSVAVETFLQNL